MRMHMALVQPAQPQFSDGARENQNQSDGGEQRHLNSKIILLSGREKLLIITIPIALKTFSRIIRSFQIQKFFELRIAGGDLLWYREFVIREVITPAASDRQID